MGFTMYQSINRWVFAGLLAGLGGCTHPDLKSYSTNKPNFIPEQFFEGQLTAHGVLKNRSGQVTRYFTADIDASWDKGVGTLAERFEFNDGEIQFRTWILKPQSEGQYVATAGDVVGEGLALTSGNAMKLEYVLRINYRGKPMNLEVEDWMWQVDEQTVINHSILRKWGFRVGSIQLAIIKSDADKPDLPN